MNDSELGKTLCTAVPAVACLDDDSIPDTSFPIDPDLPLAYVVVNLLTLYFLACDFSEPFWTPDLSDAVFFDTFEAANDFIQEHAIPDSAVFRFPD